MEFLYQIVIYPIQLFIEIIYVTLYHALEHFAGRSGYAIIGVSIAVSFLTLPMYIKAEKLQGKTSRYTKRYFEKNGKKVGVNKTKFYR